MRTALSFLVVTIVTAGSLAAQAPQKSEQPIPTGQPVSPPDPTGIFDFNAVGSQGQERAGRMVIRGTPGNYEGTFGPDGVEPLPFSNISMAGDTIVLTLAIPDGSEMVFRLKFNGLSFGGTFEGNGTGTISGNKVR